MNNKQPTTPTDAGFTLLELMVVVGVIAVLSGIGIGFLSRSQNEMDIALAVLRDKIRLAHETARNTGRSTSVELVQIKGSEGEELGQYLQARVLTTVGNWHLEPNERFFADLTPDSLPNDPIPDGRFGHCMRPDQDLGTMFALSTVGRPRMDLRDGFAFRIELYMEARKRCVVASLGPAFRLELDEDLNPIASMFLRSGDARGPQVRIDSKDAELPLRRWVTLEVVHDGRAFRLVANGEILGEQPARGEPFQNPQGDVFEVSPEDALVRGRVDEIQLLAYKRGEPAEIPADVVVKGLETPIAFDRRGNPMRPVTLELTLDDRTVRKSVAPGGVLQ